MLVCNMYLIYIFLNYIFFIISYHVLNFYINFDNFIRSWKIFAFGLKCVASFEAKVRRWNTVVSNWIKIWSGLKLLWLQTAFVCSSFERVGRSITRRKSADPWLQELPRPTACEEGGGVRQKRPRLFKE